MTRSWATWAAVFLVAGTIPVLAEEQSPGRVAERFFSGVYGCDAGVVADLASPGIVVTYPIFEKVFGAPALRGPAAVEAFAKRFCGKWAEPELVFHETLVQGDRVVLVWSFSARDTAAVPDAPRSSWGGISLFRFDAEGRIAAEIGEESTPGPMSRFEAASDQGIP